MPSHEAWREPCRADNREALESAFRRGLAVVGYERDEQGNGSFLLGPDGTRNNEKVE